VRYFFVFQLLLNEYILWTINNRDCLWGSGNEETVGTVSLVYDHHTRDLADKLTEHQHSHHKAIISTLHVHLDAYYCLEVVVIKGKAENIKKWLKNSSAPRG